MTDNKLIRTNNKKNVRQLQNMYVNSQIDNLEQLVQVKKNEIIDKLNTYKETFKVKKTTKDGNTYEVINMNPVVIQKYFFQSINPIGNIEPDYSAEKVAIIWQLYNELVLKVNAEIGDFVPTLTSFASFAGVTTNTLRNWKKSKDESFRIIVEKIYDECFDANVTLAQRGVIKERSTIYRMKSEQEKVEKEQPQIHIHNDNETAFDFDAINKRLDELQGFNKKKLEVIEVQKIDE